MSSALFSLHLCPPFSFCPVSFKFSIRILLLPLSPPHSTLTSFNILVRTFCHILPPHPPPFIFPSASHSPSSLTSPPFNFSSASSSPSPLPQPYFRLLRCVLLHSPPSLNPTFDYSSSSLVLLIRHRKGNTLDS